ncbi:MAG: MBL fold metallo-hydrolase [Dehalococcoidia bacterium]
MAVEITWLGRNCFRLRGREGIVITDPCPRESGYNIAKPVANVVTVSRRDEPGYSAAEAVGGEPRVLDAPGEYEIGGVLVTAVALPREDGARNIAFVVELENIRIAHLGLPDAPPTAAAIETLGDVDILLVPAGGLNSLEPKIASDLIKQIDPKVAIPMNVGTPQEKLKLEPLEAFLKEIGSRPEPQPRYQTTRGQLPTELTILVLAPK